MHHALKYKTKEKPLACSCCSSSLHWRTCLLIFSCGQWFHYLGCILGVTILAQRCLQTTHIYIQHAVKNASKSNHAHTHAQKSKKTRSKKHKSNGELVERRWDARYVLSDTFRKHSTQSRCSESTASYRSISLRTTHNTFKSHLHKQSMVQHLTSPHLTCL